MLFWACGRLVDKLWAEWVHFTGKLLSARTLGNRSLERDFDAPPKPTAPFKRMYCLYRYSKETSKEQAWHQNP